MEGTRHRYVTRLGGAARRIFSLDLVLLHAPSVWDFREQAMLQGPLADVIPTTDEFEIYPIGLTSLAAYLEANNYNTRIVNLAYRMLRDRDFDVAAYLRHLDAPIFGIDLHWLPHVNGVLGIAELIKQVHPDARVLIGGLSASAYHRELLAYPAVDFVLRGDSTEEPCRQLLAALREGTGLDQVENLTWKRPDGSVVVNPLTFIPADLDWIDVPAYRHMTTTVLKYGHLADVVPYATWLRDPATLLLTARGCTFDCATCGGSRSAYRTLVGRSAPAFRSPEKLVADARFIAAFSRSPIFLVHDPRLGGTARARRFFQLWADAGIRNELGIEVFSPAGRPFFDMVAASTARWRLQLTIESPDEGIRRLNRKFACSNQRVEQTLAAALDAGCSKLELYFMVGLPGQTRELALSTVDYCEHLVGRFGGDRRLEFYVAPLAPFLDPGCRAALHAELGYRRRFTTLEAHRQAALGPTWRETLSYETAWMSRDEIVGTTYEVIGRLNEFKRGAGLIDAATYDAVADQLATAQRVLGVGVVDTDECRRELAALRAQVDRADTATMWRRDEMARRLHPMFRLSWPLVRHLAGALPQEARRGLSRAAGRYDTAVTPVRRQLPRGACPLRSG